MNSAATEQLSYEQAAEFDREQLPATGERWSRRRTIPIRDWRERPSLDPSS